MLNSTLGTFALNGTTFHVEHHSGTVAEYIKITTVRSTLSESVAVIILGPHAVLGAIKAEPEWEDPPERLDALAAGAAEVLDAARCDGRGPWKLAEGSA